MEEQVQQVFRDVFGQPDLTITPATSAADIDDWTSLNHLNLVIALESQFGVRFSTAEIASIQNAGDIFTILQSKLG